MLLEKSFEILSGTRVACLRTEGAQPVLLVHGFFTSSFVWRRVMEADEGGNFSFLALDLEGFGDTHSQARTDLGFERQTDLLGQLVHARFGLQPVTVVAHAHGAIPALMLAMIKPGLVKELILVAPVFQDNFPDPLVRPFLWAARSKLAWEGLFSSGWARAHVARHLRNAFVEPKEPWNRTCVEEFWRPFLNSESARSRLLRVFLDSDPRLVKSFGRHLDHIRQPVKVLAGLQDRLVRFHVAKRLAESLSGGTLVCVENGGHFLPVENPRAILGELMAVRPSVEFDKR